MHIRSFAAAVSIWKSEKCLGQDSYILAGNSDKIKRHFGKEITMKFDYVFKHLDHSDALTEYTAERLSRLDRMLFKAEPGHVTFSKIRHEFWAEVCLRTKDGMFRARASGENLYSAVDEVVRKLEIQYTKTRKKVKNFKRKYRRQRPEGELEQEEFQDEYSRESA
jgi:putative sigma-54 modulation protein